MFKQRVLTALILGPIALLCVFLLPSTAFLIALGVVVVLAGLEWANIATLDGDDRKIYAFVLAVLMTIPFGMGISLVSKFVMPVAALFWLWAIMLILRYPKNTGFAGRNSRLAIGVLVLIPSWLALSEIKSFDHGNLLLMLLLLLVWGADIGAYCAGKLLGQRKMIPTVSPGKTWEGFAGGVICCVLIGVIFGLIRELQLSALLYLVLLSLVTCIAAVFGDLFESMMKRERGIKDSGKLLPGHGGLLDRIDSLTAAAPVFVLGIHFAPAF